MSVAYELKRKRAELVERFQQIATEQIEIQGLMGALDRVIVSYEPDYQPSPTPGSASRERSRKVKLSVRAFGRRHELPAEIRHPNFTRLSAGSGPPGNCTSFPPTETGPRSIPAKPSLAISAPTPAFALASSPE